MNEGLREKVKEMRVFAKERADLLKYMTPLEVGLYDLGTIHYLRTSKEYEKEDINMLFDFYIRKSLEFL